MTAQEQAKLRTKVRELIFELQLQGRITTADLTAEIMRCYPDLCEEEKDRLFRDALSKMAREMLKSTAISAKSAQFMLPMALEQVKRTLPASISLPPKPAIDGETGEVTMPEEVVWTPLEEATFGELELHLESLYAGIQADQARYRALNEVRNYLRPHMDSDDHRDEPIGPVLAELAAKEQEEARGN